uniref:Conserved uncharacterized protein n=1 Tax=Clytia hemisphaerica TaxID=252671 RepID=A0A069DNC8_9CNID
MMFFSFIGPSFVFLPILSVCFIILYLRTNYQVTISTIDEGFSFQNYKAKRQIEVAENEKHDKWIVITSINPPTEDVKKLAKIPGWKVVMVGDTKSPKDWSYPNVIFLDIEKQKQLGYKCHSLLKYRAYTRKNIGYLYAIQHGAKVIYETDDDNSPTNGQIEFHQSLTRDYYVYDTGSQTHVVNPYAHFGQKSIWPRGYPLDKISQESPKTFRKCHGRASIQQGVVDGDPDVDAIFRLTRKDTGVDLRVTFDKEAPPVLLPRGLMAPYNTQNTLHLYDAFWGLLIPQTVAFRVCDIWRGYWAQRLMWEVDRYLSFFPPNAVQIRNSHSYLDDFIDERELYHQSSGLVEFLVNWQSKQTNFLDTILQLSRDMVKEDFWRPDDALLVQYWLEDLLSVGYKPPTLKSGEAKCTSDQITFTSQDQPSSYLGLGVTKKIIF